MQNKALKWVLLLLLFIPFTNTFAQSNKHKLKAKKYYHKLNSKIDPLIIDTRPAFKFQESRIQNAVLAEETDELLKLVEIVPKDEPIFIYCQKGDRSKKAAETLKEKGYTHVYELKGGLLRWIEKGLPLDTVKYE